jgi:hypothetical protein
MDRVVPIVGALVMRQEFREYSGFGELLCLVLAWTVGIAAVWTDYAGRDTNAAGEKVAVSGENRSTTSYYD